MHNMKNKVITYLHVKIFFAYNREKWYQGCSLIQWSKQSHVNKITQRSASGLHTQS